MATTLYVFASEEARTTAITNDPAKYTEGNTFDTITTAINAAADGDTITLTAGEYSEFVKLDLELLRSKSVSFVGATDAEGKSQVTLTGGLEVGDDLKDLLSPAFNSFETDWSFSNIKFKANPGETNNYDRTNKGKKVQINNAGSSNGGSLTFDNCSFYAVDKDGNYGEYIDNAYILVQYQAAHHNGYFCNVKYNECDFANGRVSFYMGNGGNEFNDCTFNNAPINDMTGNYVFNDCEFNADLSKIVDVTKISSDYYVLRSNQTGPSNSGKLLDGAVFNITNSGNVDFTESATDNIIWIRSNADATKATEIANVTFNGLNADNMAGIKLFGNTDYNDKNKTTPWLGEEEKIFVRGLVVDGFESENDIEELLARSSGVLHAVVGNKYYIYNNSKFVSATDISTIFVDSTFTEDGVPEGKVFGINAFADINAATEMASWAGTKLVIAEGTVADAKKLWMNNNVYGERPGYDYVLDAAETFDVDVKGQLKGTQVIVNNAQMNVAATGKIFTTGDDKNFRVFKSTVEINGTRTAGDLVAADDVLRNGGWGSATAEYNDKIQVVAGLLKVDAGAVVTVKNTYFLIDCGLLEIGQYHSMKDTERDSSTVTFDNTQLIFGNRGTYGESNIVVDNGSTLTFQNGAYVNIADTNKLVITVNAGSEMNISGSSLSADTVTNNGTIKVTGESTVIGSFTGNAIIAEDAVLSDFALTGTATLAAQGDTSFVGENTINYLWVAGETEDGAATVTVEKDAVLTVKAVDGPYGVGVVYVGGTEKTEFDTYFGDYTNTAAGKLDVQGTLNTSAVGVNNNGELTVSGNLTTTDNFNVGKDADSTAAAGKVTITESGSVTSIFTNLAGQVDVAGDWTVKGAVGEHASAGLMTVEKDGIVNLSGSITSNRGVTVAEGGELNISGGTFEFVNIHGKDSAFSNVLTNEGTIKVTGENASTIKGTVSGNAVQLAGGALIDSQITGNVEVANDSNGNISNSSITGNVDVEGTLTISGVNDITQTTGVVGSTINVSGTLSNITKLQTCGEMFVTDATISGVDGSEEWFYSQAEKVDDKWVKGSIDVKRSTVTSDYFSVYGDITVSESTLDIWGNQVVADAILSVSDSKINDIGGFMVGSSDYHDKGRTGTAQMILDNTQVTQGQNHNTSSSYVTWFTVGTDDENYQGSLSMKDGSSLTLIRDMTVNKYGSVSLDKSTITVNGADFILGGDLKMDDESVITADSLSGSGTITIDVAGFSGVKRIVDVNSSTFDKNNVKLIDSSLEEGGELATSYITNTEGDIILVNVDDSNLIVNGSWNKQEDIDTTMGWADGTAENSGIVFGYNAFASSEEALTIASERGGATINVDGMGNDNDGSGIVTLDTGDYVITGGNGATSKLYGISFSDGANLEFSDAFLSTGKLGDGEAGSLTVKNSVIGSDSFQGAVGWATFKNTTVKIDNSIFGLRNNSFGDDAENIPRSAEEVKAAIEAGTYNHPAYGDNKSGFNFGTLGTVDVDDSTIYTGYLSVVDRALMELDNSVLYYGGTISIGAGEVDAQYKNGDSGSRGWDVQHEDLTWVQPPHTSADGYREGEAATMDITDSIVRNIGDGNGSFWDGGTVVQVGGTYNDKAYDGVLNITRSDVKLTGEGANPDIESHSWLVVNSNGTVNMTDSTFEAAKTTVEEGGTFTVSSTEGKSSTLDITEMVGTIVAADGTTLKDTTIGAKKVVKDGKEVETGLEPSGRSEANPTASDAYTNYVLSVNGVDAGKLTFIGTNTLASLDAAKGDTVVVDGEGNKLHFTSDGFKLGNGAVWEITNGAEISADNYLSLDNVADVETFTSTMQVTDSTMTVQRISSKGTKLGQEIGKGKFDVTFENANVNLTGSSAIQLQPQETAEVNITFKDSVLKGANGGDAIQDLVNDASKGSVTFDNSSTDVSRVFRNQGTINIMNGAVLDVDYNSNAGADKPSYNSGKISVTSGATLDIADTQKKAFSNSGTIEVAGAALKADAIENSGTINVSGTEGNSAAFTADSITNTGTFTANNAVINAETFEHDGNTTLNNVDLNVTSFINDGETYAIVSGVSKIKINNLSGYYALRLADNTVLKNGTEVKGGYVRAQGNATLGQTQDDAIVLSCFDNNDIKSGRTDTVTVNGSLTLATYFTVNGDSAGAEYATVVTGNKEITAAGWVALQSGYIVFDADATTPGDLRFSGTNAVVKGNLTANGNETTLRSSTVDLNGGSITTKNYLFVGYYNGAMHQTGSDLHKSTLNINSKGVVSSAGEFRVNQGSSVNLDNGVLSVTKQVQNHGGFINVSNGSEFTTEKFDSYKTLSIELEGAAADFATGNDGTLVTVTIIKGGETVKTVSDVRVLNAGAHVFLNLKNVDDLAIGEYDYKITHNLKEYTGTCQVVEGAFSVAGSNTVKVTAFNGDMSFDAAVLSDDSKIDFAGDDDTVTVKEGGLTFQWNDVTGVETWSGDGTVNITDVQLPYTGSVELIAGAGLSAEKLTINGSNIVADQDQDQNQIVVNGTYYNVTVDTDNVWSVSQVVVDEGEEYKEMVLTVGATEQTAGYNFKFSATATGGVEGYTFVYQVGDKVLPGDAWQLTDNTVKSFDVTVTVYDVFGESTAKSSKFTVTVNDETAPDLGEITASETAATKENVTVSIAGATDNFSGSVTIQYSKDGGKTWHGYESSGVTFETNGTVQFKATDAAGNVSAISEYTVSNIDKVAPVAPVASADKTNATNGNVIVSADFSTDSEKKEYSLDGKNWNAYTEGVVFEANGSIWFKGTDAAGNVSAISEYTVTNIDKDAPKAPVASADEINATNGNVTVSADFSADSVKKEYSLDGKNWNAYTEGVVFEANGSIRFKATDAAGNESISDVFEVNNIDKVAPKFTDARFELVGDHVEASWSVDDSDAKVRLFVNGIEVPDVTGNAHEFEPGVFGKFELIASDAAGNKVSSSKLIDLGDNSGSGDTEAKPEPIKKINITAKTPDEKIDALADSYVIMAAGKSDIKIQSGSAKEPSKVTAQGFGKEAGEKTANDINHVTVGNYTELKVLDNIANAGNIKVGNNAVIRVLTDNENATLKGVDANQTFQAGKNSVFAVNGHVDLGKGNDTIKTGEKTIFTADDLFLGAGNDKITTGKAGQTIAANINFGDGKNTLQIGNDADLKAATVIFGAGNDTFQAGNGADVDIDGAVTFGDGAGNDTFKAGNGADVYINGAVTFGAGKNTLQLGKDVDFDAADISFGIGNDTFKAGNGADVDINAIDFGEGKNTLQIGNNAGFSAKSVKFGAGNGNDTFKAGNGADVDIAGAVKFGDGNNKFEFGKDAEVDITGDVTFGAGNDTFKAGNGADIELAVELADGKAYFDLLMDAGNDKFIIGDNAFIDLGYVEMGAGNDTLQIGKKSTFYTDGITFDAGNDKFIIGDNAEVEVYGALNMGDGNKDTLTIKKDAVLYAESLTDVETINASKGAELWTDKQVEFDGVKGSWKNLEIFEILDELGTGELYGNENDMLFDVSGSIVIDKVVSEANIMVEFSVDGIVWDEIELGKEYEFSNATLRISATDLAYNEKKEYTINGTIA